jgi:large subunit ribosomal protein L18
MSTRVAERRRVARLRRHRRVRRRVNGTAAQPRLAVFRSLKHIYGQVIDDRAGRTLASASSRETGLAGELSGKTKAAQAKVVGRVLAERALGAGIDHVVFDRGGFAYHGRVKQLADGARDAGLKF